jgi:branched-chain amino acid transport system ATP-binding protein
VRENLRVAGEGSWEEKLPPLTLSDYFPWLDQRSNQLAGTLSGGEQKILALAMSLLKRPYLLLADEVLRGLSPSACSAVLVVLRNAANSGIAILAAEESAREISQVADRYFGLRQGTIVASGDSKALNNEVLREIYL